MVNTFVEKLTGLFDARFWIAFWTPAFVGMVLTGTLWIAQAGLPGIGLWWDERTATQQLITGLMLLLTVTIVAYILQALDIGVVRLYEGYWPQWLNGLRQWGADVQRSRRQRQTVSLLGAYADFPERPDLIMPTALGNVMRAAEDYPRMMYQLDAIAWWPRLVEVMPESLHNRIDAAFTPIVALLNLTTIFGLWAIAGGGWLYFNDTRAWLFGLVFAGGLLLAWVCYRTAVDVAQNYSDLIRVSFDYYRHDLLKKLHIPVPDNLQEEWMTWHRLTQFHLHYIYPWDQSSAAADDPFYYDTHAVATPHEPKQIIVVKLQSGLSIRTAQRIKRRR